MTVNWAFIRYLLCLAFLFPFNLLGLIFYVVPIVRRRGKVSGPAYESHLSRMVYHLNGTREDEAGYKLNSHLAASNKWVMHLLMKPLLWAEKISGYQPEWTAYPPPSPSSIWSWMAVRTEFIDAIICEKVAPSSGGQAVIIGSGWGTRPYGLLKGRVSRIFEIDLKEIQKEKIEALDAAGLPRRDVTFVMCDLTKQSWLEEAMKNGFNKSITTLVIVEGVCMYLPEQHVISTMKDIAKLPAGSSVVFDFFSTEFISSWFGKLANLSLKAFYGDTFKWTLPISPTFSICVHQFLKYDCGGVSLGSYQSIPGVKGKIPIGGVVLGEVGGDEGASEERGARKRPAISS